MVPHEFSAALFLDLSAEATKSTLTARPDTSTSYSVSVPDRSHEDHNVGLQKRKKKWRTVIEGMCRIGIGI